VMIHSWYSIFTTWAKVVNWFQIDTFMWWFTVIHSRFNIHNVLWIDFKLILLCDDSQLSCLLPVPTIGCELISNWYFYVMIHSYNYWLWNVTYVVNWFQIDTFMWWFTVSPAVVTEGNELWIDFKLILLCDDSQFTTRF